jgi:hypothetical protein
MKTYNSSDLNNKRSEILEEAASNGVVIQEKKTNGEIRREFLIISNNGQAIHDLYESHEPCDDEQCQLCSYDY